MVGPWTKGAPRLDQQCLGVEGVNLGEIAGLQRIIWIFHQEGQRPVWSWIACSRAQCSGAPGRGRPEAQYRPRRSTLGCTRGQAQRAARVEADREDRRFSCRYAIARRRR